MSSRSGGPRGRSSGRGKTRGRSVATEYLGLLNEKRKCDDDEPDSEELTAAFNKSILCNLSFS